MAAVEKITNADLEGKGITPLPDIPGLDSTTMKYKFEEIVRDVAIAKINEIIDALYNGLPLATELKAGAVKAALAESSDIQPVRIGEDGMLYTAQGSGGEYHVDDELSDTSRFPVQNKVVKRTFDEHNNAIADVRNDLTTAVEQTQAMTAMEWSADISYVIGDRPRHNGILWKCKIPNTGEEPSEGSEYWDATDIAKELPPETFKLLWTGEWNHGSITVPDSDKYKIFIIRPGGAGTEILAISLGGYVRGVGGYSSATPTITTFHFAATVSGTTWDFVACNSLRHTTSSGHSNFESASVAEIYGLI